MVNYELVICILSFVLALISVITVVITLYQNSKQLDFYKAQLEEMRKEHYLSNQPLLITVSKSMRIEKPRLFYSPPENEYSIQSRYFFDIELENVCDSPAIFVDAEAELLVPHDNECIRFFSTNKRQNVVFKEAVEIGFMFLGDDCLFLFDALRGPIPFTTPRIKVTLYFQNTTGGYFKTVNEYMLFLSEDSDAVVKTWHTILSSAEVKYKEELAGLREGGPDHNDKAFNELKQKLEKDVINGEEISIGCTEDIEEYSYSAIRREEYDEAKKQFVYSRPLMKHPYCK